MADGSLTAGDVLPAMTGAHAGPGDCGELGGGGQPADIAHIRGTGAEGIAGGVGEYEIVQGSRAVDRLLHDELFHFHIFVCPSAGQTGGIVSGTQLLGKNDLIFRIPGQGSAEQIIVQHLLNHLIG